MCFNCFLSILSALWFYIGCSRVFLITFMTLVIGRGFIKVMFAYSFRADCELFLENTGAFDIEIMEISVETVGEIPSHSQVISYDSAVLSDCLPLKPKATVSLPISVDAVANFVNSYPAGIFVIKFNFNFFLLNFK